MTNTPEMPRPVPDSGIPSFDYAGAVERARRPASISDALGNEAIDLLFRELDWEWTRYKEGERPTPPSFHTQKEVTATVLNYLAEKPIGYDMAQPEDADDSRAADRGKRVQLAVGGERVAGLDFYVKGQTADLEIMRVDPRLTRHGLGRRLMQAAMAYMKDNGINTFESSNLSRQAFELRLAMFKPEQLHFYFTPEHRTSGIQDPDPSSATEARNAIMRAYARAQAHAGVSDEDWPEEDWPPTVAVRLDLSEIDTSGWERPVPAKVGAARVEYEPQTG